MFKNTASQRWVVYAYDRTTLVPTTGDAAQITAKIRLGVGALNATDDINPTELEDGFYEFELTQAETNADVLLLSPESSTGDIQVVGEPRVAYTRITDAAMAGLVWDEALTGGTHNVPTSAGRRLRTLQDFGVYEGGAVWIDTSSGSAGTTDFENGTVSNPCLYLADALVIAASVGLRILRFTQGSSVTFVQTMDNYEITGTDYAIALNGQQVDNTVITGAIITGVALGNGGSLLLIDCKLGDCTLPEVAAIHCAIAGDITAGEAGTFVFEDCFSAIAGTAAPSLDFGAGNGDQNINFRHYSGGLEIKNMGQAGTDNMSLEGYGQLVINANCVGGTIAVRGSFKKTDNANGAVTVDEDANFKSGVIHFGYVTTSAAHYVDLDSAASAVDGAYDPSLIVIISGTGAGQSRLVLEYAGATKRAYIDRNWKVEPDTTSEFRIMAHPGREHVNEGLAQAGSTSTTIKLNALASDQDDAYNGQTVFIRAGTGEDQVGIVGAYDGTTKVATLQGGAAWAVTPDGTSVYVMIPMHVHASNASNIAAIKAKTDDLTFTKANELDTNPQSINGAELIGDGDSVAWGPA